MINGTVAVIERLEAGATSAGVRLRQLFTQVFAPQARTTADLALLADAHHPLVAPILAEVTKQRLDYITTLFRQLDFAPAQARRRALLAYSAYLGQLQLQRSAPKLLPRKGSAATAFADEALSALLGSSA